MNRVSWREFYSAAMLELDRAALPGRIEAAQAVLQQAVEELAGDHKLGAREELQAMADAQRNLRTLQQMEFTASAPVASQGQRLAEG